ncbi:fatty acid synthase-like [Frankliniella occidentalis]|uniref:Fatty acid synthase-like n=1 Tax=Frankliniella occidentalis TaxID=133901 RepID=A0A9C6U0X1_FRAOC|nr:fatty acid synthase-like [Frankliniella occidentalis]
MGSQWAGMGEALMRVPTYAATIERLHAVLKPKGIDLKTILSETGPSAFDSIMKSFVGITATQIALTNVLAAVGLRPDGIIGHSVGELGCAYADGCLTEEQAILAAWARGRASSEAKLVKGMMAAIGLGYREVLPRLPPTIEVACHNSSTSCTLSGPAEAVEQFVAKLSAEGVFARAVNVSDIAYHSTYIQPAAPFLRKYLETVIPEPKKRSPKWVSTSVPLDRQGEPWAQLCSAEYQTNNLLSPVLFEEGLAFIPQQALLVEVAPHGLLQAILKRALPENSHLPLTQRGSADPVRFLLGALGTASFHGQELDVAKLYPPVSFPVSTGTPALSPLVSWSHDETIYYGFKFRSVREGCESLELTAHSPHMSVNGSKVLPPVEELESAWRALGLIHNLKAGRLPVTFHNIRVNEYQRLPEDGSTCVVTTVSKGTGTFEVRDESTDRLLITGTVRPQDDDDCAPRARPPSRATGEAITLTGEEVRTDLASKGLVLHDKYGGALLSVRADEHEWTVAVDGASPFAAILEALVLVLQYHASEEATGVVLMQRWRRVDVDPIKLRAQHVVEVRYNLTTGEMFGEGLYATGFHGVRANSVALEPKSAPPAPLNFTFVPYGDTKLQSVGEFLSLAVQLTMESVPPKLRTAPNIRILELQNCSGPNVLGPAMRAVLQERMGVEADVRAVSVRPGQALVLPEKKEGVFLTVSAPTTMAEAVRVAAHVGGLLLTKSKSRLSPNEAAGMAVVAEQCLDGSWVSLLRAPVPVKDAHVVNMSANEPPPRRVPDAAGGPLVLVWSGQPDAGVPRVVDEVRRRPYAHLARLVFILDEDAPKFSLSEPLYTRQLALQLQVNVLRGGTWGCWQAIPLVGATPAAISATSLEGVAIEAYSLNPRVGGDPAAEAWSGHLDYAGESADGKVMGVARWLADNSRPRLDHMLRWPVPSDWGVTEAVTVPYTYATVYHALLVTAGLRRGESVLVHQGASALGQAAIRVALQLGAATVFTTVDNEAQKKFVRRLFPQLDARNVLSCVDGSTSFEWHIRTLTQQRGVNVVLSTLPGAQFKASLRCTRPWGRVLHLGRQDMLASNTFGLHIFLSSVVVQGMSGDQLFLASERDRRAVHRAVQQGLESGAVQPIEGARTFCSPSTASIKDALWGSGAGSDVAKVVLLLQQNGVKHDLAATKSFVVVGGQQQEWLQVTSLLSQHGAREVLAVSGAPGAVHSPLLRHRQRALRRLFGTNLRVEGVAHWDEAAARRVLQAAPGPVHSVVVIAKEGSRVPALLHRALGLAADAPGLLVLCERADTACGLTALCEARRAAGLRAACLSGPLASVAEHLADLLTGARPAVTLLDGPVALDSPDVELHTATPRGVPAGARALAELARRAAARGRVTCRVRELPSLGLRTRHTREALPVFAVPPLGAMHAEENDALAALALRVVNPVMVVEAATQDDLALQAACAAEAIEAVRSIGPYNVLGWGLGAPLALEVARQLERRGHHAVTFLVDGNVQRVQSWAAEQSDVSLLRAAFSDDKSQEVLESAAGGDLLESLLRAVDPPERPHTKEGFLILRTAVTALARHSPNVLDPVTGRVVEIQAADDVTHCFSRSPKVSLRRMPRGEAQLGLRSPWLANVLTENTGYSKETTIEELRPLLLALKA